MPCWCGRASVQVVRKRTGWVRLCAGHWEIEWRYWPRSRQRTWLRREKARRRKAAAKERAAKRAAARKVDGTEGRRSRRALASFLAGKPTRAETDAAKRAACAGSEQQTKPWEALGISRRTYYYRKLHGQAEAVAPGKRRQNALLTTKLAPTITLYVGATSAGGAHQPPSCADVLTPPANNATAGILLLGLKPHRFARGPQRNSADMQP